MPVQKSRTFRRHMYELGLHRHGQRSLARADLVRLTGVVNLHASHSGPYSRCPIHRSSFRLEDAMQCKILQTYVKQLLDQRAGYLRLILGALLHEGC